MKQSNDGTIEFDEKDDAIIGVIKENSSLSIQQIARKTGIPVATVHNRLKRLKSECIIKKYTVILDKAKLGRKMVAFIAVKATQRSDHNPMLKEIFKHGLVEEGAVITGQFDLLFKIRVKDMDELHRFVLQHLRKLETVADTFTMMVYELEERY